MMLCPPERARGAPLVLPDGPQDGPATTGGGHPASCSVMSSWCPAHLATFQPTLPRLITYYATISHWARWNILALSHSVAMLDLRTACSGRDQPRYLPHHGPVNLVTIELQKLVVNLSVHAQW